METAAISGLSSLALLACPIGMGLMMWLMARGNKKSGGGGSHDVRDGRPASIEVLREEQRRLNDEIDRLERAPSTDRDVSGKPS